MTTRTLVWITVSVMLTLGLVSCRTDTKTTPPEVTVVSAKNNPLLEQWETPFGIPPFDRIEEEHYLPAFTQAMAVHQEEITAIADNPADPTFANTLEALDTSGALLAQVSNVFFNLRSALTNETMMAIAQEVTPLLSQHEDDIRLNKTLFARINAVYDSRDPLTLTEEQGTLLEKNYQDFVRGGALLSAADQIRFRAINERLSLLSVQFGDNILKENNRYELVLADSAQLAGLPERVVSAAADTAKQRSHEGQWIFTLHKPSLIPFLQYSDVRVLRQEMYEAYTSRGDNNDELDNKAILTEMASLRVERAQLLGFKSHADYVLDINMAKTPAQVYTLLDQLWQPALAQAQTEVKALQALIDAEGGNFQLQPWDWWYYTEKRRQAQFDLDENELRPYFKLENVIAGVTTVAGKLYELTFTELHDVPTYHEDVQVLEV
ncbi:M3 family metallopeptidase, partial [Planctomycetota bacterium]